MDGFTIYWLLSFAFVYFAAKKSGRSMRWAYVGVAFVLDWVGAMIIYFAISSFAGIMTAMFLPTFFAFMLLIHPTKPTAPNV